MSMDLAELGMLRVAVVSPELRVADVAFNLGRMRSALREAAEEGARLVVFPELSLSGYTCGDLFYQQLLLEKVREAARELAAETAELGVAAVVGAPLEIGGRLFNAALLLAGGGVCGIVPKTYLPNTNEFYEERWFTSAVELEADSYGGFGSPVPIGTDLLFESGDVEGFCLGIEICEDLWSVEPPSGAQALAGATLIANPSASPEVLGKQGYRRQLVASQSARCLSAYLYASAGPGESSTDLVYAGHSLVCEYGQVLMETGRFTFATEIALADIDLQRLAGERRRNNTYAAAPRHDGWRRIAIPLKSTRCDKLLRPVDPTPFVPGDEALRAERCREIFAIQTTALAKRLQHTGSQAAVLGISGGLDSTLALLVTVKAMHRLGRPLTDVVAVTMPGFGTTGRTRGNAEKLAELLGVTFRSIAIDAAVHQHFDDIGHDPSRHDIVFENAQARERTQLLMDLANQHDGLVVGTGDLSELALGWCTYNADHMSMYGVNAGVPKTLVRYLVAWCADEEFVGEISEVLRDICATPVSPELLPPDANGEIAQHTEETVGPYELHDFFLFQVVRQQFPPRKVLVLAEHAFDGRYTSEEVLRWLKLFYRRFFAQQFKRSCLPDGPKVGSVALSPRGDWRMPSDACAALWLAELDALDTEA